MGFLEVDSPSASRYGSKGGPGFNTQIIELPSGAEERIIRWATDRPRFEGVHKDMTLEELRSWRDLYLITHGAGHGFRHKNWFDYASTSSGRTWGPTPQSVSHQDQVIGTGDGSTTVFQLAKTYTYGAFTYVKQIMKPVESSVVVALGITQQLSGWTLDATTGRITFTSAPSVGVQVRAGFEYAEPVRFDGPIDAWMDVSIDGWDAASIDSIPLIGLVNEAASTDLRYFGGAANLGDLEDDVSITLNTGAVITGAPIVPGLKLFLPDGKSIPKGLGHFKFKNDGTEDWSIRNSADAEVLLIPASSCGLVSFGIDSAGNGVWIGR